MASYRTKLSKPNYHNWVKASLAVLLTKEGIEPFVYDEIQQFQLQCLDDICFDNGLINGASCSICCTENVIACPTRLICRVHHGNCGFHRNVATQYNNAGCPNKICHYLKDKIQHSHSYNGPSYKNSDASQWCSNPWEVAKCFMPPDGYKDVTSPAETDFNGIISIIINHIGFQAKIINRNIFETARQIGREVRHSSTLEIDAPTLQRYFTELNSLLSDPGHLGNDTHAKEAQQKLLQLQNDKLPLGEVYIRKVLDETAEKIKGDIKKESDKRERQQMDKHLKLLEVSKKKIETLFKDKGRRVYSQIEKQLSLAVDEIEQKKSEALVGIRAERDKANKQVQKKGNEQVKKIKEIESKASKGMKRTAKEAESKIKEQVKRLKKSDTEKEATLLKNFEDDLISFYRDTHGTISVSPLIEKDTPLLKFYVMPEIYSVTVHQNRDGIQEQKTPVSPLRNMFYKEDKFCRKIYLIADAGLGKTALSKRLALTWCHAKKPLTDEEQFFRQEEIQAMKEFRFVFLVFLRDSSSECDIDDLICTHVISQLPRPPKRENLEDILFKERCLVILDGLDEWCHPSNCKLGLSSIPHRKVREQTAVLTTTRPWKLTVSGLHSSQIDQKLEIKGLNQMSANSLKTAVISHMLAEKNEKVSQQNIEEFTQTLKAKDISDFESTPLLLMYLLFLWCNKMRIGHSRCDLYCQIIELLLSRTLQKYEFSPKVDLHQGDIPQYFSEQSRCKEFYSILKALGQLAFQTLFRETREENTLVFDSSIAEYYLSGECLTFCLKAGLLTQSKIPGTLLKQISKVSFAHKTMQEFFAALYIHSITDQTSVPEVVLSKCKCVKDILEMSNIFIFLSGLDMNASSLISHKLMEIINEDEITHAYRSIRDFNGTLKQFQDMCVSCCKELLNENKVKLCLQDVFISHSCKQEQYRENLKKLTARNKQNIRSLYIDMSNESCRHAQEVIEYFAFNDLENIEKIHVKGPFNDSGVTGILPLLNGSVKCLYLSCSRYSAWSDSLSAKVTSLQKLEAIYIHDFVMSHEQFTLLCGYISQRPCMREIILDDLHCTEHTDSFSDSDNFCSDSDNSCSDSNNSYRDSENSCSGSVDFCTGCRLDLSQHSQLRKISLNDIPLSELNINMLSLEECYLQYLSYPDLILRFINCVPEDSRLNHLVCFSIKSSAAIENIQQTLPLLTHVRIVDLGYIKFGNRELLTSEMLNIVSVKFFDVTMPNAVLRGIATVLQQLPQSVVVQMHNCDTTEENESVTAEDEIRQSSMFRVEESMRWFMFESIRDEYTRLHILRFNE